MAACRSRGADRPCYPPRRMRWAPILGAVLVAGCVDLGDGPHPGVSGRVTATNGFVFLERGQVQLGTFERAGLIGPDGRFQVDLPVGGTWGVHLYFDDYFYLPLQVEVAEDAITPVEQPSIAWGIVRQGVSWAGSGIQPDDRGVLAMIPDDEASDNPSLQGASVALIGEDLFEATVDVFDPNEDLSRQILAGNSATGIGVALNPPSAPRENMYPNGTYHAVLPVPAEEADTGTWFFVAADHNCSNSALLRLENSGSL